MRVLDSELMKSYARMAMDGFNQGWHERNGGNLSYRMKAEGVEELKEDFKEGEWRVIGWQKGDESTFPGLAEEFFMVPVSFMGNMIWKAIYALLIILECTVSFLLLCIITGRVLHCINHY